MRYFTLRPDYVCDGEFEPTHLWDVLYQARFRETSELRDRIYGVLGLVNGWAGANPIVSIYSLAGRAGNHPEHRNIGPAIPEG